MEGREGGREGEWEGGFKGGFKGLVIGYVFKGGGRWWIEVWFRCRGGGIGGALGGFGTCRNMGWSLEE